MKLSAKKLTMPVITTLLLSLLLLPSAFAAGMPAGTVVSNGLTWTRNNSTVSPPGKSTWGVANDTCQRLTAGGYTDWRLPVNSELNSLDKSLLKSAGWTIDYNWSQTPGNGNSSSNGGHNNAHYAKYMSGQWGTKNDGPLVVFYDSGDAYVSCVR